MILIVAHVHLMLVNPCETLHLNLGVQLVGSWHAHFDKVHGYGNMCNLNRLAPYNQVGRS